MRNVCFLLSNSPLSFLVPDCTGRPTNRADNLYVYLGLKDLGLKDLGWITRKFEDIHNS